MSAYPTRLDILRKARALIADESHWCKNAEARSARGGRVSSYSERAVSFCPSGAIDRVHVDLQVGLETALAAVGLLEERLGGRHIENWNDAPERTHADVLAAFDAAIAELEAKS